MYSKSDFFYNSIKIIVFEDRIVFEAVGIDYSGKTTFPKFSKKNNRFQMSLLSDSNIITGKYEFDEEESTEDIKVIYF